MFQVMNGLVHGDTRGHVILSPWSVIVGANHVCECIAIAVNTTWLDHGDLPEDASAGEVLAIQQRFQTYGRARAVARPPYQRRDAGGIEEPHARLPREDH